MIAQLPTPPENGFSHYAMLILGWIFSTAITLGLGYWFGLRSQVQAEKLKARNAALAVIDGIVLDVPKQDTMPHLFTSTLEILRKTTVDFSSQLNSSERLRTEKALKDYQALQIKEAIHFTSGVKRYGQPQIVSIDRNKVKQEREAMLKALNHLRDVISKS